MNGKKARAMRQAIYGDMSQRDTQYARIGSTVVCTGLKAEYQGLKKYYKNMPNKTYKMIKRWAKG